MSAQNKTEKNDGVTVKRLQMDSTSVNALKVVFCFLIKFVSI